MEGNMLEVCGCCHQVKPRDDREICLAAKKTVEAKWEIKFARDAWKRFYTPSPRFLVKYNRLISLGLMALTITGIALSYSFIDFGETEGNSELITLIILWVLIYIPLYWFFHQAPMNREWQRRWAAKKDFSKQFQKHAAVLGFTDDLGHLR